MNTIITRLKGMKLNQKISFVVFGFALAPIALLAAVLFGNMREMLVKDRTNDIAKNLVQVQVRMEKTAELCNMTRQVFINNARLREFLINAKSGQGLSTEELLEFRRSDLGALEKLINANPYLYQVRVYYDNENLPEMMPILYHTSRMTRLSWAQGQWISGQWQLGYEDKIFPAGVMKPVPNIMSLVTEIKDYEWGALGVLEVAVRMDELMPELYTDGRNQKAAFVTKNGETWYSGDDSSGFWRKNGGEIFALLQEGADTTRSISISGDPVILSSVLIEQIGGWYIIAAFPREITAELDGKGNMFFLGTILFLLLLAIVINFIIKAMLRRFYQIVRTVSQVREGKLEVRVPDIGSDEVGALGEQFNIMLDKIIMLMDENVRRQLLAKNSEIRALQSQINAHFIYNVLESIKMMAEVDHKYEIADSITSLGKILRYSMQWTAENVLVRDEIGNVRDYLSLINLRFDYHIELKTDIPPQMLKQKIPRLTLQPIVENAVIHGIEELDENTSIDIAATARDGRLFITVTDYGAGIPVGKLDDLLRNMAEQPGEGIYAGKGIGLKNVNDRIVMAFGNDYGLSLTSEQGRYTCVSVCLPYEDEKGV